MDRGLVGNHRKLLALVLLAIVLLTSAWVGPRETFSQEAATPPATPAMDPVGEVIGLIELPTDSTYAAGTVRYLTRWTFGPGASYGQHQHDGTFMVAVESGALCYQQLAIDPSAEVVAEVATTGGSVPRECSQSADLACGDNVCTLKDGDVIYLPAGSTLAQFGTGEAVSGLHSYKNVDTVNEAVIFLTGTESITTDAGCGSSCP
jgi:hypothetical protein